ncbi:GNAT superfamily N-acetyltransferase [Rhizobium soli]|uniref:GNAT superfamily N-acetyltransferase n=1 Tax=Rhizobium soli TaxID=424798 RepID=A0A7X0JKV1_9HYPH|nr:GNAT family N-acetyltransferase [Rhizobium soli]MBB6508884.1 GNAT superfamily N-acetyltransferase [Rhizobium soli]
MLTLAEVERLLDWAGDEGWNPGLADAAAFHAADPEGFFGCFVDGVLAAGISAVRYGSDFGFIGLYIAHPDFRGQGMGRRVWDAGMAHLEGRTIGLDGVSEQQQNYASIGFELFYETIRWSGRLEGAVISEVSNVSADILPAIIRYDGEVFSHTREAFLAEWLKPPRLAKALMKDGRARGYGVCRKCSDGFKIGPLFAMGTTEAVTLLQSLVAETECETVHIDVPAPQQGFSDYLSEAGFQKGFTTARMYRGLPPSARTADIFGVTTLELG